MDDLIKRTEVIKAVHEFFAEKVDEAYGDRDEVAAGEIDFILKYNKELNGRIEKLHTVEAKTVVHGEWVHSFGDEWKCSECGDVICTEGSWDKPKAKFCEECGADMRKKVE